MRGSVRDLAERWELPEESVSPVVKVTLTGQRQVMVEQHRGLLAYGDTLVEVGAGRGKLRILGSELRLGAMDRETLVITGRIQAVEYA